MDNTDNRYRPHLSTTIDPQLLRQVEDYRYANRIPTRASTIEELLRKGLASGATQ